jgi:hypothetical protein
VEGPCARPPVEGWPTRGVAGSLPDRVILLPVPCPSGRRIMSRKHVWGQLHRGFKSHRYRHRKPPFTRGSSCFREWPWYVFGADLAQAVPCCGAACSGAWTDEVCPNPSRSQIRALIKRADVWRRLEEDPRTTGSLPSVPVVLGYTPVRRRLGLRRLLPSDFRKIVRGGARLATRAATPTTSRHLASGRHVVGNHFPQRISVVVGGVDPVCQGALGFKRVTGASWLPTSLISSHRSSNSGSSRNQANVPGARSVSRRFAGPAFLLSNAVRNATW